MKCNVYMVDQMAGYQTHDGLGECETAEQRRTAVLSVQTCAALKHHDTNCCQCSGLHALQTSSTVLGQQLLHNPIKKGAARCWMHA
jgi:hypothetical protein